MFRLEFGTVLTVVYFVYNDIAEIWTYPLLILFLTLNAILIPLAIAKLS